MLKPVLRDTLTYGLASVVAKGMAVFLLPLYTRVMSTEQYGAYDILVSVMTVVNILIALEIAQGLSRFWPDSTSDNERRRYAGSALVFVVLMSLVFLGMALAFSEWLTPRFLGSLSYLDEFRLAVVAMAAAAVYHLLVNQFRWELKSRAYAVINVLHAVSILGFAIVYCLILDFRLWGVFLAQLSASTVGIMVCFYLLRASYQFCLDLEKLRAMLRFSVQLVPSSLAVLICFYSNRFAINYYGSLEDVAIYGLGTRVAALAVLMIAGIQGSLMPLVYRYHKEPDTPKKIARIFSWFIGVAVLGCLFLVLFSKELLYFFAPAEFSEAGRLVVLLAPALLMFQMNVFAPGVLILKRTYWHLLASLSAAFVAVLLNYSLVPYWGIYGAAAATLVSAFVLLCIWILISQRLYPIPYAYRSILLGLGAYVGLSWLGQQVDQWLLEPWLSYGFRFFLMASALLAVIVSGLLPLADILEARRFIARLLVGSR